MRIHMIIIIKWILIFKVEYKYMFLRRFELFLYNGLYSHLSHI